MRKNLHISKICCTFAPDFKNKPIKGGGNTINSVTKNMTRELLNKIVKANKINLEHYDHIWATINEAYTFVTICFCNMQVCGGEKTFHNQLYIRMSTAAMMKRGELPEDYETRSIEWIYEIR